MIVTRCQLDDDVVETMNFTIYITMPLQDWRMVMMQQAAAYPSSELGIRISACLSHVARATATSFVDPPHADE